MVDVGWQMKSYNLRCHRQFLESWAVQYVLLGSWLTTSAAPTCLSLPEGGRLYIGLSGMKVAHADSKCLHASQICWSFFFLSAVKVFSSRGSVLLGLEDAELQDRCYTVNLPLSKLEC